MADESFKLRGGATPLELPAHLGRFTDPDAALERARTLTQTHADGNLFAPPLVAISRSRFGEPDEIVAVFEQGERRA